MVAETCVRLMASARGPPERRSLFDAHRARIAQMTRSKRIVCFANSRKLAGRCIKLIAAIIEPGR